MTLTEPSLLGAPVGLRPIRSRTPRPGGTGGSATRPGCGRGSPPTPRPRCTGPRSVPTWPWPGPCAARPAQGMTLPWVVTYDGQFAGQLTVGGIVWGSSRSAQVGLLDRRGVRRAGRDARRRWPWPWTTASSCVGLHRVEATIRPENEASRRVVEKLGFREEGLRRRSLHIDGAWRDHLCYALTVEDVHGGLLARWRSIVQAQRSRASSLTPPALALASGYRRALMPASPGPDVHASGMMAIAARTTRSARSPAGSAQATIAVSGMPSAMDTMASAELVVWARLPRRWPASAAPGTAAARSGVRRPWRRSPCRPCPGTTPGPRRGSPGRVRCHLGGGAKLVGRKR